LNDRARAVLVTGAAGYIGSLTVKALAARVSELRALVALDVREVPAAGRLPGVSYAAMSVTDPKLRDVLAEHRIDTVVHLASVLRPPKENGEAIAYQVDVLGTENVLSASVATGVRRLVVTTSGAAYGYRAREHLWLEESDAIEGNREIPYAWHKRLIEGKLAEYRERHPELAQLVFRPVTVIGETVRSPVTDLFERPFLLGVKGFDSPFVFIWDQDVVACLVRGVFGYETGIYNLAGDGALDPREIARRTGKKYLPLPERALRLGLSLLHRAGKSPWGPDQVLFLKYRPVLSNRRLKREFGYTPKLTSSEAFDLWVKRRR
jgi:UDP-glucose 4-epimerase